MRYFIVFLAFILQSCLSQKTVYKPGNITYSCEGGKIQCLSEKDRLGRVFVQLKSLDPHTTIEFEEVFNSPDQEYIVKALMIIDRQNTGFASSKHFQSLFIDVSPVIVEASTLQGEVVFQTDSLKVMID
jgi:hypothetical protein